MSSGPFTGSWYDWPSPLPMRARNSWNAFCTKPVRNTTTDHREIAIAATSVRRWRSASVLSGTEPARNRIPKAAPIAAMTASSTPRLSWMSGAMTGKPKRLTDSRITASPSTTSMERPPTSIAARNDMALPPTPGSKSSGSTVSGRGAFACCRRSSSSSTALASAAASSLDRCGSPLTST